MGNACCGSGEEASKASALHSGTEGESVTEDASRAVLPDPGLAPFSESGEPLATVVEHHEEQQPLLQQPSAAEKEAAALRAEQLLQARRMEMIVQEAGQAMVPLQSTRGVSYYDQGFAAALAQHLEQTTEFPPHLPVRLPPAHPAPLTERLLGQPLPTLRLPRAFASTTTNTTTPVAKESGAAAATTADPSGPVNSNPTSSEEGAADSGATDSSTAPADNNGDDAVNTSSTAPPQQSSSSPSATTTTTPAESLSSFMDRVGELLLEEVVPRKERLFAGVAPMVENLL